MNVLLLIVVWFAPFIIFMNASMIYKVHSADFKINFEHGLMPLDDHGELGQGKDDYDTCIVVGFLSRSIEFGLREWQRNEFKQQLSRLPDFYKKKKVHIQQLFMIGINPNHSTMESIIIEQRHYGDVMFLKINEGYHYLTANTWDTFHEILPLLENPSCRSAFLVRADTDFVLNYKALTETIVSMPKTSTYFGTMVPNYPTPEAIVRQAGSFADDFLPVWAIGGLYGFSLDVVKQLVSYDVERTILKKDERYVYPEEDRAVGLALSRSNTTVKNYLFTKATFHFCPPENFTCADYGHFMGFSVGYGKSGSGQNRLDTKLEHLQRISELRNICEETLPQYNSSDYLFNVDNDFKMKNPFDFLTYGCTNLSDEGEEFFAKLKESYSLASVANKNQLKNDDECAERIYLEVNPEVNLFIQNGVFSSGKEHYLRIGHRNSTVHYYCPRVCKHDPNCSTVTNKTIFDCDREDRYFKAYPDVNEAVQQGIFKSGRDHFQQHGEGKIYECPVHDIFKIDAKGTKQGCYDAFETFISKTTAQVREWPVTGNASLAKTNDIDSCSAVLFVDGRDSKRMDYVLRNHRHFTGPNWMFYLVGPKKVAKKWRKLYEGPMVEVHDLPERFGELSDYPRQINELYMSTFLWKDVIKCENVLVSQTDALMLRHGIEDFFKYSYVGGPVYPESHPTIDWRVIFNMGSTDSIGGNGGFSFRKRSYMLEQLSNCKLKLDIEGGKIISEDGWYSACLLKSGAPLATPRMANRFSPGSTCEVDVPVGVHKLWQNCEESTCIGAIATSDLYNTLFPDPDEDSTEYCTLGDLRYLARYPDVMKAVKKGIFKNGFEHFDQYGRFDETYTYKCMYPKMNVEEIDPFQVNEKYFATQSMKRK